MKKNKRIENTKSVEKEVEERVEKAYEKLERNAEEKDKRGEKWIKRINNEKVLITTVLVLVIIIAIAGIFPNAIPKFNKNTPTVYSVDIIKIGNCENCFDINLAAQSVKKIASINLKSEKELNYTSSEAEKLMQKYNIKRIPSLIILSRDIKKIGLNNSGFRNERDAAIFDKGVPYLDLTTGKIKGIVTFKEIQDSSCVECPSLSSVEKEFETLGIKKESYEILSSSSEKGKELIKDNNIKSFNNLLIGKEIEEYWWIFPSLKNKLTEGKDYYSFTQPLMYPYKDAVTGEIKGKVEAKYITANDCQDCFNVSVLKEIFQKVGIYISKENYIDYSSNEGKEIVSKYNITTVPTVILSKEISDYNSLKRVLEQIGSFEGQEFVFRKPEILKVKYQSLLK